MTPELMKLNDNDSFVTCPTCSVKFEKNRNSTAARSYCSVPCKVIGSRVERIKMVCPACEIQFERIPSQASTSKYCSRACKQKDKINAGTIVTKQCECCGKDIDFLKTYYRKSIKYCSRECNFRTLKRKKRKLGV